MPLVGRHVVIDAWGVDPLLLDDKKSVLAALQGACAEAGATILHSWYHQFSPQGVTALVGLAESHASIHTYPELGYYSADLYTCGDLDPRLAMRALARKFGGRPTAWLFERGRAAPPERLDV